MKKIGIALLISLVLTSAVTLFCVPAHAAGIRVVPSVSWVTPGSDFYVDVVAEGIPADGLGGVQFRLNVSAPSGSVAGLADLSQAGAKDITVGTPLLVSASTATHSGIGSFFLGGQGGNGILVMDNESLVNGSALYTFAHTNGASPPSGSGTVARFMVRVGSEAKGDKVDINLSDVMLMHGGPAYPLDYATGASIPLKCMTKAPSLFGLSLDQAKAALASASLILGTVYEIDNSAGKLPLNVVLEQSVSGGSDVACQTAINLAVNTPPLEVTNAAAIDKPQDGTGSVLLSWVPSASNNSSGYRIYREGALLQDLKNPSATGVEIGSLPNGIVSQMRITVYDTFGNESQGVMVAALPVDDVPPVVTITSPKPGYINDNRPILSFSATKGVTTTRLDGAIIPAVSGVNLDALSEGSHTITVESLDSAGYAGSASVTFVVDTLQPSLTVNSVTTPTNASSQIISGTVEAGAVVTVAADTGASSGAVTYPTSTTWSCTVAGLVPGDNTFTVSATDPAGNVGKVSALIRYFTGITAALAPDNITSDYGAPITLAVRNLSAAGGSVLVEQFVDANRNGVIDTGDYVIRSFSVTDGAAQANPNIQGDEDGAADSAVTTSLKYYMLNDLYHAPGRYIFRVKSGADTATASFAVNEVTRPQSISGTVTGGTNPLPGAVVQLADKWKRPVSYAIADENGRYRLYLKDAGDYIVSASAYGYATGALAAPVTTVAGQNVTGNVIALVPGTFHVTGRVKDGSTGTGIGGVWVKADGSGASSVAITGADGGYSLALPAGQYSVAATTDPTAPNPSGKGYLAFKGQPVSVNVSSDTTVGDISLTRADILLSGRVFNTLGAVVTGMPVQAAIPSGYDNREPVAYGLTDSAGNYTLAIASGGNWNISLHDPSAQIIGYIGTSIGGFSTSNNSLTGNDLTANPITAWVQGKVTDSNNNVLANSRMQVRNSDSSVISTIATASDGTYRIGAFAGSWLVDDLTHSNAMHTVEQAVTLANSQTATVDFVIDVTPPGLTIDTFVSPSISGTQTITGTVEAGSAVTVTVDTSATVGPVSYPTSTTWSCTISGLALGNNNVKVTATDAQGNIAEKTTQIVYALVKDVTSSLGVTTSGYLYGRVTKTYSGTMSITNNSQATISGPFLIALNNLTSGVTLVNATGSNNGVPYIVATAPDSLAPGQSFTVTLQFSNPSNQFINFTTVISQIYNHLTDVSSSVNITASGYLYGRVTKTYSGTMSITNNSQADISGSFVLLFNNLTSGVSLVNATGTNNGAPYIITTTPTSLSVGQTFDVTLQFSNPSNQFINFSPVIFKE